MYTEASSGGIAVIERKKTVRLKLPKRHQGNAYNFVLHRRTISVSNCFVCKEV